jgi:hypothetical protein
LVIVVFADADAGVDLGVSLDGIVGLGASIGIGEKTMMSYEKLDVYQCSIQFLAETIRLIDEFPPGGGIAHSSQTPLTDLKPGPALGRISFFSSNWEINWRSPQQE